jgi:hypothetical protein
VNSVGKQSQIKCKEESWDNENYSSLPLLPLSPPIALSGRQRDRGRSGLSKTKTKFLGPKKHQVNIMLEKACFYEKNAMPLVPISRNALFSTMYIMEKLGKTRISREKRAF